MTPRPAKTPRPDDRLASLPCALSIAGSDSGGGAGIQADLRAFAWFSVFGLTAITAVTAQNPRQVADVHIVPAANLFEQIEAVFAEFAIGAVKTGMLANAAGVRAATRAVARHESTPLVLDPVMAATSGARLLEADAAEILEAELLPRATIVTPNLPEAEILLGRPLRSPQACVDAARELAERCRGFAMIKGGHSDAVSVDWVSDGERVWRLSSPKVSARTTHGTGCALSAAAAACLARGLEPLEALHRAKAYVYGSLKSCRRIGPDIWGLVPPDVLPLSEVVIEPVAV
ncbi:MAG: bifunctional hydroxymethylpyrimidine kinase/phosphomethylpyrimidine kinase [Kiritimatiellaeota bacterium]|nr:bifunctional hydroxymethylpyrimidine kinase/phosphomethylpyrimidine kinase [Kiritimatiellota bacterium]